jgi:hypothetical protein
VWIGQSKSPKRRYTQHASNPPSRVKKDALKYAPFRKNFKLELLFECTTHEQADIIEERYVKEYRSTESKYGYNILRGALTKSRKFWYLYRLKQKK